jgi:TatA/E family protein of Tat protein translocase
MPDFLVVLVIVLVAVVFWRGPKNLPKLGEALGRGVREARREASEMRKGAADEPAAPTDPRADE